MSGPTWKRSEWVDVDLDGHTWRFRRLGARRMNAMKVRLVNIRRDDNVETFRALCEADEIEKMLADLAEGLARVDNDPLDGTTEQKIELLDMHLDDGRVLQLWSAYLNACSLTDDDRGKSAAPSSSHSRTAPNLQSDDSTTVAGAVTASGYSDVAGTH